MLHLQDTLYNNTENNYMTGILMTDLSSAFDTVDHKILLQKMNYMGVVDNNLKWFESYLSGRKQLVQIETSKSTTLTSPECSVIQGGVGSGTLYTIYTNEIPAFTSQIETQIINHNPQLDNLPEDHTTTLNFVDDSNSLLKDNNVNRILTRLTNLYTSLHELYSNNKLWINPDKTQFMISSKQTTLHRTQDVTIQADQYTIKQSNNSKILGAIISKSQSHTPALITGKNSKLKMINNRIRALSIVAKYATYDCQKNGCKWYHIKYIPIPTACLY
jgi:hypothetical protein